MTVSHLQIHPGSSQRSPVLRFCKSRVGLLLFGTFCLSCALILSNVYMLASHAHPDDGGRHSRDFDIDPNVFGDGVLIGGDNENPEGVFYPGFMQPQFPDRVESLEPRWHFIAPKIPVRPRQLVEAPLVDICWKRIKSVPRDRKNRVPPSIIPRPVEMTCEDDNHGFALSKNTTLYYTGTSAELLKLFHAHFVCFFKFDIKEASKQSGRIELVENREDLPAEGYSIQVQNDALVVSISQSNAKASLLYALQSLRQIVSTDIFNPSQTSHVISVPLCSVRDWPRYKWRGLMVDVARHFFNVSEVKDILLLMSMHKLNTLHLHLTDDQGWRMEVGGKAELTQVGARRGASLNLPWGTGNGERIYTMARSYQSPRFFSKQDMQELIAFASALEIEIVPEIDVPAHTAALIVAARSSGKQLGTIELHEGCAEAQGDKDLTLPPNCMGGTHGILVPTNDTLRYVLEAIADIADLFPSKYFHAGGDEADEFRDTAYSSEAPEKLKQDLGIFSSAALQGYMISEVYKFLKDRGKTVIAWDETHVGLEGFQAPQDMVAMWWRDFTDEASWFSIQGLGRPLILAPMSKMYMDIYQTEPHASSRYRVQEGTVGLHDTYSAMQFDAPDVLGVQACLWSEHFETLGILEYQMFPRGAAAAEVAWSNKESYNFEDFQSRWQVHKERLAFMGVEFYDGSYTNQEPYTGEPRSWSPPIPIFKVVS